MFMEKYKISYLEGCDVTGQHYLEALLLVYTPCRCDSRNDEKNVPFLTFQLFFYSPLKFLLE